MLIIDNLKSGKTRALVYAPKITKIIKVAYILMLLDLKCTIFKLILQYVPSMSPWGQGCDFRIESRNLGDSATFETTKILTSILTNPYFF